MQSGHDHDVRPQLPDKTMQFPREEQFPFAIVLKMILNAIMQATSFIIDPFNTGNGMGFAQAGQAAGVYFDPLEPIFGRMDVRRIIMAYKNELHPCRFFVDHPNYYFYSPLSSLMPKKDLKNIAYYDEIARDYDALMNNAHSNAIVRKKVTDKFLSKVAP